MDEQKVLFSNINESHNRGTTENQVKSFHMNYLNNRPSINIKPTSKLSDKIYIVADEKLQDNLKINERVDDDKNNNENKFNNNTNINKTTMLTNPKFKDEVTNTFYQNSISQTKNIFFNNEISKEFSRYIEDYNKNKQLFQKQLLLMKKNDIDQNLLANKKKIMQNKREYYKRRAPQENSILNLSLDVSTKKVIYLDYLKQNYETINSNQSEKDPSRNASSEKYKTIGNTAINNPIYKNMQRHYIQNRTRSETRANMLDQSSTHSRKHKIGNLFVTYKKLYTTFHAR